MRVRPVVGAAVGSLLLAAFAACSSAPENGAAPAPAPAAQEQGSGVEPAAASDQTTTHDERPRTPSRRLMADGLLPGMARYHGGGPQVTASPQCSNPQVSYFGGPILQNPVIVAVFWNSAVNAQIQANMGQFYADVTQSSYWPWLQEYDSVGLTSGGHTGNQVVLGGTSGGSFVIVPSLCPASTTTTCKITDAQLQAELTRQIGSGVIPAPALDCTGNSKTLYMVSFPPNISLTGPQGVGKSCVQFCAYHNTGTYGSTGTALVYAALMDEFTGGCASGCGTNATPLENQTDTASHELVEAVTDPDIGLDTGNSYAYPAGWGDNNNGCGEVGDICDDGGTGDTITVSGRSWVVQEIWSNKQIKCTSTGTAQAVCSGTTVTNCRKCSCGDDGAACSGSTSVCETTSTNVLFGGCEQCTSTDNTCGTFSCQQSATPAQDDICSSCTPITTCPAGDNCGTVSNGCGGTINCGTCTAPQTCGGGTPSNPNVCGCTPRTTCPAGDNCGTVPDGCGGAPINCGTCTAPQTCGGGTPSNPNVCGCTAKTTCPAGDNCGTVSNGCGGTVDCGTCTAPQTCGGGTPSNPNQCGCTPTVTSCPAGDNCGTVSNGCGGTVSCGTCAAPQTCGGGTLSNPNACGCTPATSCPAGQNCGTAPDGCGGTINCGNCSAPQTCGGTGTSGVCGCRPFTTCPTGENCGIAGDGCGGTLNCGTCGSSQSCVSNQCVATVPDGGTTTDAGAKDSGATGDGGGTPDSGTTTQDSGTATDSGTVPDSGTHQDSGGASDGSTGATDSASDAEGDASGDAGPAGPTTLVGGCGCKTAQASEAGPSPTLLAFGAIALLGGMRLRRRTRAAARNNYRSR